MIKNKRGILIPLFLISDYENLSRVWNKLLKNTGY